MCCLLRRSVQDSPQMGRSLSARLISFHSEAPKWPASLPVLQQKSCIWSAVGKWASSCWGWQCLLFLWIRMVLFPFQLSGVLLLTQQVEYTTLRRCMGGQSGTLPHIVWDSIWPRAGLGWKTFELATDFFWCDCIREFVGFKGSFCLRESVRWWGVVWCFRRWC